MPSPALGTVPPDSAFYKDLLDQVTDGVYFVDRERRIVYWNKGATRLTGYKPEEVLGRSCTDEILCHVDASGNRLCRMGCPLSASIEDGEDREAPVFLRHKRGRRVPVLIRVRPIRDANGSIVGAVEIFTDASSRLAALRRDKEMERLAFLDSLTHLPNRRYLEMSIRTAFHEFQVHADPFGLLLIDLDHFKAINDQFGHPAGDLALQEVGETLVGALRTTDIIGRWGGDEFVAVVRHVDTEILDRLAGRCCALVAQTKVKSTNQIALSVSVGGAVVQPGDTYTSLMQRTDDLMYRSKALGRGRATVFAAHT